MTVKTSKKAAYDPENTFRKAACDLYIFPIFVLLSKRGGQQRFAKLVANFLEVSKIHNKYHNKMEIVRVWKQSAHIQKIMTFPKNIPLVNLSV
jgi:hypothetical protein